MTKLIYAGSHQQFVAWCRENNVEPRSDGLNVVYVGSVEHIYGFDPKDVEVVYYGTYYDRPDWTTVGPLLHALYGASATDEPTVTEGHR